MAEPETYILPTHKNRRFIQFFARGISVLKLVAKSDFAYTAIPQLVFLPEN